MIDIIIIGAGQGCLQVINIIQLLNKEKTKYNIIGLVDDNPELHNTLISKYKVLGQLKCITSYSGCALAWGLGNPNDPALRSMLVCKYNLDTNRFLSLIHPSVIIDEQVSIGKGINVDAGSIISSGVHIKNHCSIGRACVIQHGVQLDEGVLLASGVIMAGNVNVGKNTYIGQGANIIENVTIGNNCMIGLGAIITKNVDDNKIVYCKQNVIYKEKL